MYLKLVLDLTDSRKYVAQVCTSEKLLFLLEELPLEQCDLLTVLVRQPLHRPVQALLLCLTELTLLNNTMLSFNCSCLAPEFMLLHRDTEMRGLHQGTH
jgi:hypothetical protein